MDWKLEVIVIPVSDVDRAKEFYVDTVESGVDGEIQHFVHGKAEAGPDPDRAPFNSFVFFADRDGNGWAVQEGSR